MGLITAIPALAETLFLFVGDYGITDLGTVYERASTTYTPDSVPLNQGKTAIGMLAPSSGIFNTEDNDGRGDTGGPGAHVADVDTVKVICFHAVYEQTKIGDAQVRARPYPFAVRAAIRRHNRLQTQGSDPLWKARAERYDTGYFEWGGQHYYATVIPVTLTYDHQLTPGDD